VSGESAPRAIRQWRLFVFAAVLSLGSIILGAQSAKADGNAPELPVLRGHAPSIGVTPTHVHIAAPIRVVVAHPSKSRVWTPAAKAGAKAGARGMVRPVAAAVRSRVAVSTLVTSVVDGGSSQFAAAKKVIAPRLVGQVTKLVTGVVATSATTATSTLAVELKTATAQSYSAEVIARREASQPLRLAHLGATMNEPIADLTFDTPVRKTEVDSSRYGLTLASEAPLLVTLGPTSTTPLGTPKTPVRMPCSTSPGASGTGSGGNGSSLADLSAVPHARAALLHCGLPVDSPAIPQSPANDPGSRPA
jgi:hypothetical protein